MCIASPTHQLHGMLQGLQSRTKSQRVGFTWIARARMARADISSEMVTLLRCNNCTKSVVKLSDSAVSKPAVMGADCM